MGAGFRPDGMEPGGPRVPPEWEGLDVADLPWIPVREEGQDSEGLERQKGIFRPEKNEDGTITLPDGTTIDPANRMPPDHAGERNFGGFNRIEGQKNDEISDRFKIVSGGNMFLILADNE